MPRYASYPTLYDECLTLSITDLKRLKYLLPNHLTGGILNWMRNKEKIACISVVVNTNSENPHIEFDYRGDGVPINYVIQLASVPSNLKKGFLWFFICPITGKLCRKLYLIANHFYHRSAFTGCMYSKQTESKKWRVNSKLFGYAFETDDLYIQLYKKHFKKQYAGKPTKKYLWLLEKINNNAQFKTGLIESLPK